METRSNAPNTGSSAAHSYAKKTRRNVVETEMAANVLARSQQLNGLTQKGDDPRRGVTGVVVGSGSGGVEPNPLSGHGGCNRRGSRMVHGLNQR